MLNHRVIPCLLVKDGGIVKTRKFKEAVYLGDPINAVRIFNDKAADELIVLDIGASRAGCGPNFELVEEIAGECFMPLCYGGGIRSVEDAQRLFEIGVEKVSLQSAAFRDPTVVREIAERFGQQSIVVSIDVKRSLLGKHKLFSACGAKSRLTWQDAARMFVGFGAGEILLNSVDRDGTMTGMDLRLIEEASALCEVPLVAAGGAGSLNDLKSAVDSGASAVAAGAMFVFQGRHRAVLITYPSYSELQALWSRKEDAAHTAEPPSFE